MEQQFDQNRGYLEAVAYRMLGSRADAEDAVQEAWLRVSRADTDSVENMRGWLTTIVSRICLDMLRTRKARREELVEGWLPEPQVTLEMPDGPEQEALIADSVGLALLVVLEMLTPAERLAFVLHDTFAFSFEEIAPIVDRSVAATRQLASRARRRVRGAAPPAGGESAAEQGRVVDAFLAAAREGDFERLLELLDPDVVFRSDRGRLVVADAPPPEVRGARAVAEAVMARAPRFAHMGRAARVNGGAGVVVARQGRVIGVVGMTIAGGRITELDLVVNPDKLRRVRI